MEYIFDYKVSVPKAQIIIAIANAGIELSDEQFKRVMDSKNSGKYEYMDQDPKIRDIYQIAYEAALEVEKSTEYGDKVGNEIFPIELEYPVFFDMRDFENMCMQ